MVARVAVTADTNVYVSALHFGGTPRRLLEVARGGLVDLAVSDAILDELDRVLRDKFGWTSQRAGEAREAVGAFTRHVTPDRRLSVVADDPDDDRILECAVAAGAQFVVSGDRHLLRLGAFEGISILTVAEFLAQLAGGPGPS